LPLTSGNAKPITELRKEETEMKIIPLAFAAIVVAATPASAGGLLERLLFGSLVDTQAECQAQNPGNFSNTWR
jgi:hypothetical protein